MEPIKKIITQANTQINHERDQFARTLGITGIQMSVIDFIGNNKRQVSQQAIEQEFGIRRSTTTIMIKRMENHRLVEQVADPNDKRKKLVKLLPKAIKLIEPIKKFMKNDDLQIRQKFSDEELAITRKVLTYIRGENKMEENKISGKVIAAVFATGIMSFCGVLVETAMNITFPTLMDEFNIPTNLVQWMTTIYLLIVSIVVPISAILKKKYPTKKLFLVANLAFIIGVLIDAFSPVFALLLVGRAIQGIGTGIALPLMFNIILEQVPIAKVGFMMGVGSMITGIAPAVGPTFGGVIVNTLGWRWIFAFLLPFLLISLFLGLWGIQQKINY